MAWPTTSRHARGYGARWDRLRVQVLRRDNYLCQCNVCRGGLGRVTTATDVHHIVGRAAGGSDDPGNLTSLSHDCHERIELEKRGAVAKPRVMIGLDGFPIGTA